MLSYLVLTVLAVFLWRGFSATSSDVVVIAADRVHDVCNQIKSAVSSASDVYSHPCEQL